MDSTDLDAQPRGRKRSAQVLVRLTPADRAKLEDVAEAWGWGIGATAHVLLVAGLSRILGRKRHWRPAEILLRSLVEAGELDAYAIRQLARGASRHPPPTDAV